MFDGTLFLNALLSPALLWGAGVAVILSLLVFTFSFVICLPLAIWLDSKRLSVRLFARGYTWIFRAAPLLLVLLLIWNGLPQILPGLVRASWYSPFLAAFLAMSLVSVAYLAEVMRGALRSVGQGQRDAAMALGLRPIKSFFLISLPQALRVASPVLMNELITMVKLTSLAYVISVREIMAVVNDAISSTFRFVEWYSAALVYYIVIVSILMVGQMLIEARRADYLNSQ